jgi:hypothetical protein
VSAYTKKSKKKKKRSAKERKTGGDAEAGQKVPKSGQPVYGPQP